MVLVKIFFTKTILERKPHKIMKNAFSNSLRFPTRIHFSVSKMQILKKSKITPPYTVWVHHPSPHLNICEFFAGLACLLLVTGASSKSMLSLTGAGSEILLLQSATAGKSRAKGALWERQQNANFAHFFAHTNLLR